MYHGAGVEGRCGAWGPIHAKKRAAPLLLLRFVGLHDRADPAESGVANKARGVLGRTIAGAVCSKPGWRVRRALINPCLVEENMLAHNKHAVNATGGRLTIAAIIVHVVEHFPEHPCGITMFGVQLVDERLLPEAGVARLRGVHSHAHAIFRDAPATGFKGESLVVVVHAATEQRRPARAANGRVHEEVGHVDDVVRQVVPCVRHRPHRSETQILVICQEHDDVG